MEAAVVVLKRTLKLPRQKKVIRLYRTTIEEQSYSSSLAYYEYRLVVLDYGMSPSIGSKPTYNTILLY